LLEELPQSTLHLGWFLLPIPDTESRQEDRIMATPKKPNKRQAAKPALSQAAAKPAKPRIRLAVIRAIIREGLQQAKLRIQYEEDGMKRLLQALREVKPAAKRRKAG